MADERITDDDAKKIAEYLKTLSNIRDIRREISEYSKEDLERVKAHAEAETILSDALKQQNKSIDASIASAKQQKKIAEAAAERAKGTTLEQVRQNEANKASIALLKERLKTQKEGSKEFEETQNAIKTLTIQIENNFKSASEYLKDAAKEGAKLAGSMCDLVRT